jgi:hypothetical protein
MLSESEPPAWWPPLYTDILADFGWREADDRAAAELLRAALPKGRPAWLHIGTELKHRARAVVVGCGPALDDLRAAQLAGAVVVAADGATQRLREIGVVPRVVVTDLDGDEEALVWAAQQGAGMVVHAHGDNRERIARIVPRLGALVVGTFQCDARPPLAPREAVAPLAPLRNVGGLTDGDRAAALCHAYHVREIALACFDLDAAPSRYSGSWDPATKPRKLAWAKRVLDALVADGARITRVP